jgi:ferredoxin
MMPESKYKPYQWNRKSRFEATVDPEKCIGCRRCVDLRCQFGAAQMKYYPEFGEERAYIDTEKCMGCGCCVETCLVGARGMKIVRPLEYLTTPLTRANFGEPEKG